MSRPLRIEYPGALYHITSRGNAKQVIFLDDEDMLLFLRLLGKVVKEFEWNCYSYCLMDNHYHLLVETPKANLSRGMQLLNGTYAQKFNDRHKRVGHVLQGRYHSVIVDKEEYLLEVCRYIVLNPVRAGMVGNPAEYRWSCYLGILYQRKAVPFLDTSYVLSLFSQPGRKSEDEYRAFVSSGLGTDLWANLRGGIILGSDEFASQLQNRIGLIPNIRGVKRSQLYAGRPELASIFGPDKLDRDRRNQKILEAHSSHGYTCKEIANYLNLHHSSVCRAVRSEKGKNATFEL